MESQFLPHFPVLMTYAITVQFGDTLHVTIHYKKSLHATFIQNSFSEHIVLYDISWLEDVQVTPVS
jgi:hypothetical protein